MTKTAGRWGDAPVGAVRWARAVVVALLAAVAVLVHHDATGPKAVPGPSAAMGATHGMGAMHGMGARDGMGAMHGMGATHRSGATHRMSLVSPAPVTTTTAVTAMGGAGADLPAGSGDSTCASAVTGHCSAASLDTVQLVPPPADPRAGPGDAVRGVRAAHSPHGVAHRAPPDLSLLSRLLI